MNEDYSMFKGDTKGKNADYIPYLAQVNSKLFGVAVVTTDNKVYTLGDIDYSFSIQPISKVFTLPLAMQGLGADAIFGRVGSEPTDRPFNSGLAVVDMPTHTGNPLVNAGAIATTSLVTGSSADEKGNKILAFYSKGAGEKLTLIHEVYKSEAASNQATARWRRFCSNTSGFSMKRGAGFGVGKALTSAAPGRTEVESVSRTGWRCGTACRLAPIPKNEKSRGMRLESFPYDGRYRHAKTGYCHCVGSPHRLPCTCGREEDHSSRRRQTGRIMEPGNSDGRNPLRFRYRR